MQDTMCTPSLGMDTTCGSYALVGAKAFQDAEPIKKLLAAGMIILGKTNPSVRVGGPRRNALC